MEEPQPSFRRQAPLELSSREADARTAERQTEIEAPFQSPSDRRSVGAHLEEHGHGIVDREPQDPGISEAPRRQGGDREPKVREPVAELLEDCRVGVPFARRGVPVELKLGDSRKLRGLHRRGDDGSPLPGCRRGGSLASALDPHDRDQGRLREYSKRLTSREDLRAASFESDGRREERHGGPAACEKRQVLWALPGPENETRLVVSRPRGSARKGDKDESEESDDAMARSKHDSPSECARATRRHVPWRRLSARRIHRGSRWPLKQARTTTLVSAET